MQLTHYELDVASCTFNAHVTLSKHSSFVTQIKTFLMQSEMRASNY